MRVANQLLQKFEFALVSGGRWTEAEAREIRGLLTGLQAKMNDYVEHVQRNSTIVQAMADFIRDHGSGASEVYVLARKAADKKEDFEDFTIVDMVKGKCQERPEGIPLQQYGDVVPLYEQARKVLEQFRAAAQALHEEAKQEYGNIDLSPTELKLKHIYRIIEKTTFSIAHPNRADGVLDIVRCLFICPSKAAMVGVLRLLDESKDFEIVRIKDRWREPTSAGWSDFMVNVLLTGNSERYECANAGGRGGA